MLKFRICRHVNGFNCCAVAWEANTSMSANKALVSKCVSCQVHSQCTGVPVAAFSYDSGVQGEPGISLHGGVGRLKTVKGKQACSV